MRKPTEDPIARTVAENQMSDQLTDQTGVAEKDVDAMRKILGEFPAVEFETTTRDVQGQTITLRRLVITGPWEVAPQA